MTPHRMLNPRTGRWSQPDPFWNIHNMQFGTNPVMTNNRPVPNPWAIAQSGNLFLYCVHNPVRFIDPSGLEILLAGTADEQRILLSYLQQLTDHTLDITVQGSVFIAYHALSNLRFPGGNELIERMLVSAHVVTINLSSGANVFRFNITNATNPEIGTGGRIYFNPTSIGYTYTRNQAGITSFTRAPVVTILAHELIHADRAMRGAIIPLSQTADITIQMERARFSPLRMHSPTRSIIHHNILLEEWATIGLGHFTDICITENMIRREHGLNERSSQRGEYR